MTQTDIANLALTKLGDLPITDIDSATDKGARLAKLHYQPCLSEALRAHFWGFAMGAASLTRIPDVTGTLGWSAAFELPSDFVKLRAVYDASGVQIDKFDIRRVSGTRCLVAGDYDSLQLDYVQFVDEPSDFDPLFSAALVTLLASRMARAITGADNMEASLRQIYETVDLPAARCADGHDTQSGENHPLRALLGGALTHTRADFFPELDD
jgi:hypothetical protein